MANLDRPNGFTPVGTLGGGSWQGKTRWYPVNTNTAADIATGDVVSLEANGNVELTAATAVCFGVVVGISIVPNAISDFGAGTLGGHGSLSLETNFFDKSAGIDKYALVAVGPDVLYEVQSAAGGAGQADVGANADLVGGASGTSRSIMELAAAGTGTAQFHIHDVVLRPDNELGSIWDRYVVSIHEYQFANALAGI